MSNLEKYSFPSPNGGLVLSTEPFPNGNMIYATAQWIFLNNILNVVSVNGDPNKCSTYHRGLISFERDKGLTRYLDQDQNTSIDDYLAFSCVRPLYLLYVQHFGFLDINYPKVSFSQWMYRFQTFWVHMKISAGLYISPLSSLIWSIGLYLSAQQPTSNEDSWIQSHLMVETYNRSTHRSWICDKATKYWKSKKTIPTSQIMANYLGPDCLDHPLIEVWRPYN